MSALKRKVNEPISQIFDNALWSTLNENITDENPVNLFSGGVDSSLVHFYLGSSVPAINIYANNFEFEKSGKIKKNFELEKKYCDEAAELLNIQVIRYCMNPNDYLTQLIDSIRNLGCPPHQPHMIWFSEVFREKYKQFIIAERADALFGHGGRVARAASIFASPAGTKFLAVLIRNFAPFHDGLTRRLVNSAYGLKEDPNSPVGYGALTSIFTDLDLLNQTFGQDMVSDRLHARLEYMTGRVTRVGPSAKKFVQHFETAQLVDYFCEDTFALYRQLALARGKTLFSPFLDRKVVESAMAIPARIRYINKNKGKFFLKQLLKSKLPEYKTNKNKAYPFVHFPSYYPDGPLSSVWERYRFPDVFPKSVKERLVQEPNILTWQAIKYAIWEDEIQKNSHLADLPKAIQLQYDF